jgi:magnesium transporter
MTTDVRQEPWEHLEEILRAGDAQRLKVYIRSLSPGETARALSRLRQTDQTQLLLLLSYEDAAVLLEELSDAQAADMVEELRPAQAAAIVGEMPSDEQVDLLNELGANEAVAVLQEMPPEQAESMRRLRRYPADSAGGLMVTEYLVYPETSHVADVLDDLQKHAKQYARYDIQYLYVTAPDGKLLGVVRLRDLLFSPREAPVATVMIANPLRVYTDTTLDELQQFFDRHPFFGVPVVEKNGALVGVVRRADVEEAAGARADATLLKLSGIVGGEEIRTLPLPVRVGRRFSWLSLNIVLNMLSASVIVFYQDTLAAAIALAVFLPIISDMSGCSGNQAVAVSLRELTLGLVRPYEIVRVVLKEAEVGLINGVLLGLLLGGLAWAWKGNPYLGLVVGGALALNTLVAVALGGTLPLVLQRLNVDPALASGPILTTVTDMCGFFLALSFAAAALSHLAS